MANFSLSDLADSVNDSTGNFLRDTANQAANFACGIYRDYPQWAIDPLNAATGINNPIAQFQKGLWDKLCSSPGRPGLPAPPPPPSFKGGQCLGVEYRITVVYSIRKLSTGAIVYNGTNKYRFYGKVLGLETSVNVNNVAILEYVYEFGRELVDSGGDVGYEFTNYSITNVERMDGQPDNCGDPPSGYPNITPHQEALTQNITVNQGDTNITFQVTFNSSTTINIPIKVVGTDPESGKKFDINFNFDGVDFNFGGESTPDSDNINDIKNKTDETNNTTKETNDKVIETSEDVKKLVEALDLNVVGTINAQPCGKAVVSYNYSGKTFLGLQAQINSLANMLARVHEDICSIQLKEPTESTESELLSRIYQILGGNIWFNNTQTPLIKTKGEEAIKNFGTAIFGENTDQLNEINCTNLIDLIAINAAVNYYRLGLQELPATLPASLITKYGDFANILPNPEAKLHNYIKLFGWYIERFDELLGQWEVPIEVKDIDPNTPGDQTKIMKFPNVAEAIAEMLMLLFQISINGEIITNLATRTLMEAGQDKQQNLITYHLLQSLTDYVGHSYKDKIVEMPLLFDPTATDFDKLLTEVKIKVGVPEYDEKLNLQASLGRYNKAASILDSVYYRKIDPNGDIKAQLMKRLFDMRDMLQDINPNQNESFKKFLEDVEAGFTNTPGVGDPTKPYGQDYEDRPRFRDFTAE